MGTVYEEITLKNVGDVISVERGYIKEPEIRETTVQVVVDTGAETLIINESVQKQLGLNIIGLRKVKVADGEERLCQRAEPVEVIWKDRDMTCRPWVLPGAPEVLLGAIPLEEMDLIVDPKNRQLIGAHGDQPLGRIY
jgi:clan AA aspartic protease